MSEAGPQLDSPTMPHRRPFLLLLTVIAAIFAAGCGSEGDPIPPDEAGVLLIELDALEGDVESGDCASADEALNRFGQSVADLGGGVDREVRKGLTELVANLDSLLIEQCMEAEPTTTTSTTETTTTTEETTTSETTDPTTTDTTDTTTPTTTTDGTTTVPPGDGGSGGSGPSSDK